MKSGMYEFNESACGERAKISAFQHTDNRVLYTGQPVGRGMSLGGSATNGIAKIVEVGNDDTSRNQRFR